MAARRLIVVLVLLLAASIVAASVAPERTGRLVGVTDTTTTEETSTTTETTSTTTGEPAISTTPAPTPEPPDGVAISARIKASVKHPETVHGHAGDQLALAVGADPPRPIAIPSLGLTEFAAEDAPAHFNLLLRAPGNYAITDGDDPSVILGRIKVSPPAPAGAPTGRGEANPPKPEPAG